MSKTVFEDTKKKYNFKTLQYHSEYKVFKLWFNIHIKIVNEWVNLNYQLTI